MRLSTLHGLTASPTPPNPSVPAGCLHPVSVPTFPSNPVLTAAVAHYEAALGDPVPTLSDEVGIDQHRLLCQRKPGALWC